MLDHITIAVADFARSKAFYEAALKPLGLSVVMAVTAEETGGEAYAGFRRRREAVLLDRIGSQAERRDPCRLRRRHARRGRRLPSRGARRRRPGQRRAGPEAALPRQLLRRFRPRSRRQQHRGGLPQAGMSAALQGGLARARSGALIERALRGGAPRDYRFFAAVLAAALLAGCLRCRRFRLAGRSLWPQPPP